jgi:hypothetical protein
VSSRRFIHGSIKALDRVVKIVLDDNEAFGKTRLTESCQRLFPSGLPAFLTDPYQLKLLQSLEELHGLAVQYVYPDGMHDAKVNDSQIPC